MCDARPRPNFRFPLYIKNRNFDILGQFSFQKIIYGPYGSHYLAKSPYMDCTDHIFLLESPYMDRTDLIFLVEVYIWTTPTTYFGMKSNPKPISQNQIPNLYSGDPIPKPYPKPNPKPTSQTQSRTYIPKNNPKPISQNLKA